ncbi:c-type cytochrome [Melioribacteraceae bacterium 4301-Me]|uniref:c-type cytochrome n=1 Tax=Pyranulibacter aquaticus TaxID=3163344 RepID=UPI003594E0E0
MEFLDKLVIPQSAEHMVLLKYLLVLTFILFISYFSLLFGSAILSIYFNRKAQKENNHKFSLFAKDLIDLVTFNKSVPFGLGFIPLLSSMFCYSQLLHQTQLKVPEFILLSLLFFIIGVILIYTYKYSFHLKDIFNYVRNAVANENDALYDDVKQYKVNSERLIKKSGKYGLIFLFITIYLFLGAVNLAIDSSSWGNSNDLLSVVFSLKTIISVLQFIAGSLLLTSGYFIYLHYRPNSERKIRDEEYSDYAKKTLLSIGLISTLILPLIIVAGVLIKPKDSLSFGVFGVSVILLFLVLIIANYFYFMIKKGTLNYSSSLIYLLILFFLFGIIKDQLAFDTSTKEQFARLADNYNKYEKKEKELLGGAVETKINGADIYNGRCIACHAFDHKVVGPPYNSVLPKYEGKEDELIKFILNPVKKNPDYPAMPNQGLKPAEAKAVAEWLLQTYKSGK